LASQTDILARVISELNAAEIDYMIVGSVASSAYGFVRDTHDLDLVVALRKDQTQALADALGEDFYFDVEGAVEAIERGDMFNVIHYESSLKVDFWILKDDVFTSTQFSRRRMDTIWGMQGFVESPEDTILSKLLWYKITPSERQLSDAKGVLILQKDRLDYDYLHDWAAKVGVADLLASIES